MLSSCSLHSLRSLVLSPSGAAPHSVQAWYGARQPPLVDAARNVFVDRAGLVVQQPDDPPRHDVADVGSGRERVHEPFRPRLALGRWQQLEERVLEQWYVAVDSEQRLVTRVVTVERGLGVEVDERASDGAATVAEPAVAARPGVPRRGAGQVRRGLGRYSPAIRRRASASRDVIPSGV